MANILDYLDWRGDLTFAQDSFNTVDALILAQLSYVPLDGIVPLDFDARISLKQAAEAFDPEHTDEKQRSFCYLEDQQLLAKLGQSRRFQDVLLTGYFSRTAPLDDLQFSAMTCILPDGSGYISFRGTDGSIAGWKEDFNISYMSETPGQQLAVEYVSRFCKATTGNVMLGGHSKGGNFAVYAAVFCDAAAKRRLLRVYDFDGPGFRDDIAASKAYTEMLPRIYCVIPQSSLVGQLLTGNTEHQIVKSSGTGVGQHLIYSWNVQGRELVFAQELSKFGVFINRTLNGWLSSMDAPARRSLTEAVFDVIQAPEKDTFYEMNRHKLRSIGAIVKAMRELDPEAQAVLKNAIALLAQQSKKALFPEKHVRTGKRAAK